MIFAVEAYPPIPEEYFGIAYINGEPAPDGSVISIESYNTGQELSRVVVDNRYIRYGINYNYLQIYFEDTAITSVTNFAVSGEEIVWKINGVVCDSPAPGEDTADIGGVNSYFNVYANISDDVPEFGGLGIVVVLVCACGYGIVKRKL